MREIVLFIAMSLDGYIADSFSLQNWKQSVFEEENGEHKRVVAFTAIR